MPKGMGRVIAQNKKANHDYFIEETYECGLVLLGTEIKSVRAGKVSIKEAFARLHNGEVFVYNMNISHYEQGNRFNHDPIRNRKLLLNKKQIQRLIGVSKQTGYTLIPLKIYIKNGYAKLLLGVGRGKQNYDKRQDLKKRDAQRQVEKALRQRD